jgi:leucine dehydrogenase
VSAHTPFGHEKVILHTGPRSGLPIIVAVHSTALGSAVGGCRMIAYPRWEDGLRDALRLSEAMSLKCAASGLPHGGGKTVIALPESGAALDAARRTAVMEDLGDLLQSLDGSYHVGEDVGTGPDDMLVVRGRTTFASMPGKVRPDTGERPEPTALGVLAAVKATAGHVFGTDDLAGRRLTVIGLGHVGLPLARMLAAAGARLAVTDVAAAKRADAAELGARWLDSESALYESTDIVIPAALGGILTPETVGRLDCAAVVGPANNQLSQDLVAAGLRERGIVWAPDFIVNAGGVLYEAGTQLDALSAEEALAKVRDIGPRLAAILAQADEAGTTPLDMALAGARAVLVSAGAGAHR